MVFAALQLVVAQLSALKRYSECRETLANFPVLFVFTPGCVVGLSVKWEGGRESFFSLPEGMSSFFPLKKKHQGWAENER